MRSESSVAPTKILYEDGVLTVWGDHGIVLTTSGDVVPKVTYSVGEPSWRGTDFDSPYDYGVWEIWEMRAEFEITPDPKTHQMLTIKKVTDE